MKILEVERSRLEELRSTTSDKKVFIRCSIVIMRSEGFSYEDISVAQGISIKTVQRVVRSYELGGIDELVMFKYVGSSGKLSKDQVAQLDEKLQDHLYVSASEIKDLIYSEFGIEFSLSGVCALLKRMGYVYKKSKVLPGKADGSAQVVCAEQIKELIDQKHDDTVVFFTDGSHPTHNTEACYGWIKRGQEYAIPSNTGRKRVNINGAMNAESPEETYVDYTSSVNAQSTVRLLEKILKGNEDKKKIIIYSDNATYYKNRELKEWLKSHEKIEWRYLPAYSPNLNLIERLWGLLKRKVLKGYYYDSYDKFKKEIEAFFNNLSSYREELIRLMRLEFQIISWS